MCIDFNPRLREGGDIICIVGNSCIVNFNPRLREGGDKIDILFPPNKRYFNPRLREGGDVLWILLWILWITISIHASAKEATVYNGTIDWKKVKFQSTPPRRRRRVLERVSMPITLFQSTPPRRRRPASASEILMFIYFNPRLREGGDRTHTHPLYRKQCISIHASAKEATYTLEDIKDSIPFQSTPPRRRRRFSPWLCLSRSVFQSTPPRRRRPDSNTAHKDD